MIQSETTNHPAVIYSITTQDVLIALSRRIDPSTLSPEDLQLAIEEVKDAINHHLDIRDYINIGLDVWEIDRKSVV